MLTKGMENFLKHKESMDEAEQNGEDLYFVEFRKIRDESDKLKSDLFYSTSDGEKPCNTPKNRYKDILPFNYNRVKLKETSEADNDYINASLIKSPGRQMFIAAQGPLPKTVADFWSMIWDYNVRVVIMACQEYEGHPPKLKCFRYWNQSKDEKLDFGKITVTLVDESVLPDTNGVVARRELVARKDGESKTVVQLHHQRWPDKFIPTCLDSILGLLSHTRAYHGEERGEPILVHCSAGCGRTGSLIVIEYVWSLLRNKRITDEFNLLEIIISIRKQRMAIVQSLDQYQFVYGVVAKLFQQKTTSPAQEKPLCPVELVGKLAPKLWQSIQQKPPSPPALEKSRFPTESSRESAPKETLQSQLSQILVLPPVVPPPPLPPMSTGKVENSVPSTKNPDVTHEKVRFVRPTNYRYKLLDIGFPNRVPKPRGPRPMPQSV